MVNNPLNDLQADFLDFLDLALVFLVVPGTEGDVGCCVSVTQW